MPLTLAGAERLTPTASTTKAALAANSLRLLGDFPFADTHTNAPGASDTSLTVADSALWEVGDFGEWRVDSTGEQFQVTALPNGTTLTIRRGVNNTTAAAHAANAIIHKSPRFMYINADKAVDEALANDLYPEIFAVYGASASPASPHDPWIVGPSDAERILKAYQKSDSSPTELQDLKFSNMRFTDSTFAATKKAFRIPELRDDNNSIFVQYAIKPAIGDVTTGQARMIEYLTCARLLEWEQGEVIATVDEPQSAQVAPGQDNRTAAYYRGQAEAVKAQEVEHLNQFLVRPRRWVGPRHYSDG